MSPFALAMLANALVWVAAIYVVAAIWSAWG